MRSLSALSSLALISGLVVAGVAACSDDVTPAGAPSENDGGGIPNGDAGGNPPPDPPPADGGADAPEITAETKLTFLAPLEGSETRRLLRTTVTDADGIAKISYSVDKVAPVDVAVTGAPTSFDVKAALLLTTGDHVVTVDVEDTLGNKTSKAIAFRYGLVTAGGGSHSAVITNGKIYAFGRNNVGQLGIGTADPNKSAPTLLVTTATPSSVVFNQNSSLFVDTTGGVWVWGENTNGELGLGDMGAETRRNAPTVNPMATGVAYAALGYNHTIVIGNDGTVRAWGKNDVGQVGVEGDGTETDVQANPVAVTGLGKDVVKVIAGSAHSAALTATGEVFVWGRNQYGNLGTGTPDELRHPTPAKVPGVTDIVDIANGRDHILAVKADGSVVAWGLSASGQVGYGDAVAGDFTSPKPTPAPVVASGDGTKKLANIATVFANGNTSFALTRDGKLWGWGEDGNGTLAQGGAGGSGAMAHKAGFAIRAGVYTLGATPEYLDDRAKLRSVAVGALHVVVMTEKKELYTWGWNTQGTLGVPDFPAIWRQPTPALVTIP